MKKYIKLGVFVAIVLTAIVLMRYIPKEDNYYIEGICDTYNERRGIIEFTHSNIEYKVDNENMQLCIASKRDHMPVRIYPVMPENTNQLYAIVGFIVILMGIFLL